MEIGYEWSDEQVSDPNFVASKVVLWRSSFWDWFLDCVWTTDESDIANPVKRAPAYRYLREIDKIESESKVTDIVKSRRMFVSHFEFSKILWNFLFIPFSKNLIISKKENDVKEALRHRILAMYGRLDRRFPCHPELKQREHIQEMQILHPDKKFGSHILGLPSGADQIRSYTATRVLVDEFAFHDKKDQIATLAGLNPAIYGDGKATIVSTPKPNTKFEELVTQLNPAIPVREIMTGVYCAVNKLNQTVIGLKYTADPAKRTQEWYYREHYGTTVEGVPIPGCSGVDEFTWRMEYELSFDFPVGTPVVSEYRRDLHCAAYASHGGILEDKPLELGIDFGSRFPAATFSQIDSLNRLILHDGLLPEDMQLDRFLDLVENTVKTKFAGVRKVNYYCDPAGAARDNQGKGPPAAKILMERFKCTPKYRLSNPGDRAMGIRKLAGQLIGGAPGIIVNPLAGIYINPSGEQTPGIIPKGLETGWVYDENDKLTPKKDKFFEHIFDAFGYAFIYLYPSLVKDANERRMGVPKRKTGAMGWVLRR